MVRVIILMMVIVVGLWVMNQATNAKRVLEQRHATLVAMVEVAGK